MLIFGGQNRQKKVALRKKKHVSSSPNRSGAVRKRPTRTRKPRAQGPWSDLTKAYLRVHDDFKFTTGSDPGSEARPLPSPKPWDDF